MAKVSLPASKPGIAADIFARLDLDPALRRRRTTSDYIAEALRTAILDGQFADGEELNQVALANKFKVSRVPLREALRQLQAEGLVSNVAHRRTVVIGLELSEIIELIEIRAVLEGYLVEKAGPKLESADLGKLRQLCDEMDLITAYDHEWVLKNWEFHRCLYEPSEASAAIAIVEQLHLKVERYVRRAGRIERLRQAAEEHRRILGDVERKDFARAREHLQSHIFQTGDDIRKFLTVACDT